MRYDNLTLKSPGETVEESPPAQGEGDFLSRLNVTVDNIKELMKLANKLRGSVQVDRVDGIVSSQEEKPGQGTSPPGVLNFVELMIKQGYGDTPVGQLFQQIAPHTLKNIVGILKNARPQ